MPFYKAGPAPGDLFHRPALGHVRHQRAIQRDSALIVTVSIIRRLFRLFLFCDCLDRCSWLFPHRLGAASMSRVKEEYAHYIGHTCR